METLGILGRTLGFSLAAGVNLYATIAIVGLAARFGWVALPAEYQVFAQWWVIAVAAILYCVEFVADKVPWLDSLWDAVHTFVRPVGGAALAVTAMGPASPGMKVAAALLGATVAASSHMTKAGTRVVANTSPEPFSNWVLSLMEDGFVVSLGLLALKYPVVALAVSLVVLAAIGLLAGVLFRAFRRRFGRQAQPAPVS
jgi:hypothetical protein